MKVTTMTTSFLLILLLGTLSTASTNNDHYLLSCGTASTVAATSSTYDGRTWYSDNNSTFSTNFTSTATATASTNNFNLPQIPFSTVRIFTTNFTYSFPVSPGPKFIRLFFYPSIYSSSSSLSLSPSDAYLTVQANSDHLLLRNFSAYLFFNSSVGHKEFYVHVSHSLLRLTLSPTPPSSYAFINGIEVVSVPENVYVGPTSPINVANPWIQFDLGYSAALETAYRVNVGGKEVGSLEDSGNMYRQWLSDEPFLSGGFYGRTGLDDDQTMIKYTEKTPSYTAPAVVYQSFRSMGKEFSNQQRVKVNLTWGFEVDLGFMYLVRLHWCEVVVDIFASNYRVFDVYIGNLMAEEAVDVFKWVGPDTAVYRDYVVYMGGGNGSESRGTLQLAMHPNTKNLPVYYDVLLNGLEIFKISRSDGSLDAPNPSVLLDSKNNSKQNPFEPAGGKSHLLLAIIGGAFSGIVLITLISCFLIFRRMKATKKSHMLGGSGSQSTTSKKWLLMSYKFGRKTSTTSSSQPPNRCCRFLLSQIKSTTDDFSGTFMIGTGGFGNVYVGTLDCAHGAVKVAIKRLKPSSKQGANEFRNEIETLSNLRHEHLVPLIGYCDEQGEMILVYEYMEHGTLRDHLYNTYNPPLSWTQRLTVCIGAARGLHYLHAGGKQMIIHRDVKSSNILLDKGLVAKVSDFGLSKVGPTSEEFHHISTRVKGSLGYVDPEYYRRKQLTEKSDVYSFGVVLFEVLCGRPAVNLNLPKEEMNIALWVRRHQQRGNLGAIVDPNLKRQIEPECLKKFGEIAERCARSNGTERPSMAEVVQALEICSVN